MAALLQTILDWSSYLWLGATLLVAILVVAGAPRERANQLLASAMMLIFIGAMSSNLNNFGLGANRRAMYAIAAFNFGSLLAFIFVYTAFVGLAVRSPLCKSLATRRGQWILLTSALFIFALPFLTPTLFMVGAGRFTNGVWTWDPPPGVAFVSWTAFTAMLLYTLVASADAWRRAPRGSPARSYARTYLVGFGLHDVGWMLSSIPFVLASAGALDPDGTGIKVAFTLSNVFIAIGLTLVGIALVRHQLFTFDLKVKWTLRRGSLVGVFFVAFFIVAAVAEQYLQTLGYVAGGIAVGLLLFAVRPIERAIDRLADRAMPRVQPTPSYLQFKKLEVYRAAVESAHETGGISDKERASLERLREKLGIAGEDARALESEITQAA